MQPKPLPQLVVYVDVDNTLVRTFGARRVPLPEMVKHVVDLKRDGSILYCFSGFLPKPHIEIDDQAITDWPYFRHFYPSRAPHQTAADYRRILEH